MSLCVRAVLALALLVSSASAGRFLDQSQAGVVTTYKASRISLHVLTLWLTPCGLRAQIPSQGVWQSFKPAWTGDLNEINVFLGADVPASACVPYRGTLSLYRGSGKSQAPFFTQEQLLIKQEVTGTCQCTEAVRHVVFLVRKAL